MERSWNRQNRIEKALEKGRKVIKTYESLPSVTQDGIKGGVAHLLSLLYPELGSINDVLKLLEK